LVGEDDTLTLTDLDAAKYSLELEGFDSATFNSEGGATNRKRLSGDLATDVLFGREDLWEDL
ncbi:MAG: hypothetical protein Q4C47_10020, partial [Planctomycetia bacterium]|nr:hypothetical protein [Planctomycetia bacterium]